MRFHQLIDDIFKNACQRWGELFMRESIGSHLIVVLLVFSPGQALATHIDRQVVVNPVQVCDDDGTNCSNPARILFEAETDKIWSQAGIDVKFLPWKVWNHTASQNIESSVSELILPGNQAIGGNVINMFFVDTKSNGAHGTSHFSSGYTAVMTLVFNYANGAGRRDTISHEIGHILGLGHIAGTVPLNLMEEGFGVRDPATAIGQIFPDGEQKDQLNASQIATARSSPRLAILPELAGDYNADGVVDAADYTTWRDNLGASAGTLPNDIDGVVIGPAQYNTWKHNFGATLGSGAGSGSAEASRSLAAVPEPASWLLLASMVTLGLLGQRAPVVSRARFVPTKPEHKKRHSTFCQRA
jgi:hypothetical protein